MSSKKDGKGACELNRHNWLLIDEYGILQSQQGVTFALLLKVSFGQYCFKLIFQLVEIESSSFNLCFSVKAICHDF